MSDTFINVKGRVEEVKINDDRYTVKVNGDTYSFFETKKSDGLPTVAKETFEALGVQVGKEIGLSYTLSPDGKYKNVKSFADPNSVEYQEQNLPKPAAKTNLPPKPETRVRTDDPEGRCRHAYLLEAYRAGTPLTQELLNEIAKWAHASMTGELKSDLPF